MDIAFHPRSSVKSRRSAKRLRDIEDLLAERRIIVSYETVRQWFQKFGLNYAKKLRNKQG